MFSSLPDTTDEFISWPWARIEPYVQELLDRPLDAGAASAWLADWTRLGELIQESYQRLYVATTLDTTNAQAEAQYTQFLETIFPAAQLADQRLKEKLLASGLEPEGMAIPLRNMRAEADLFRESNLPLLSEELKLANEYDKIIGAQTVQWEGQEMTVSQLRPIFQHPNRQRREDAWRLGMERQLADRQALNALWEQFMTLRRQMAANAGMPDYRAYRWQQLLRFDYTPEDCETFHRAIETAVTPAAERLYEKRRQQLGVESLRPWDLSVDPLGRAPLRPYHTIADLETACAAIFQRVASELGAHFAVLQAEGLLDLDNRKGKAPGAYCTELSTRRKPFVFMNAVGLHDDVQTMLHECGHAFHVFESAHLPHLQQKQVGMEFAEVASMAMELLAAPYLVKSQGGFYSGPDAARARAEHLESMLDFWPYMAVVDSFQQWTYTHPEEASDPKNCDAAWAALWRRFMRGVDWSGMDDLVATGWQRKQHIFQSPFYYVEYGLAQMGAVQVWRNARQSQANAVAAYRRALSLGGTASLPQLYATAGARFAFDADTLGSLVSLIVQTIAELE